MRATIKSYSPDFGRVNVEYVHDSGIKTTVSIDAIKDGAFITREQMEELIDANTPNDYFDEFATRKQILESVDAPDYLKNLIGADDVLISTSVKRQRAYFAEADGLFFKWQRGEATKEEWLDKVAEIKSMYPDAQ